MIKLIKTYNIEYEIEYDDLLNYIKNSKIPLNNLETAANYYIKSNTKFKTLEKFESSKLNYEDENINEIDFYLTTNKYNI